MLRPGGEGWNLCRLKSSGLFSIIFYGLWEWILCKEFLVNQNISDNGVFANFYTLLGFDLLFYDAIGVVLEGI